MSSPRNGSLFSSGSLRRSSTRGSLVIDCFIWPWSPTAHLDRYNGIDHQAITRPCLGVRITNFIRFYHSKATSVRLKDPQNACDLEGSVERISRFEVWCKILAPKGHKFQGPKTRKTRVSHHGAKSSVTTTRDLAAQPFFHLSLARSQTLRSSLAILT